MIYLKLFLTFFKIGAFTFGGGYAMLPFVTQEVLKNGWMTTTDVYDFIAISESTPGPFGVNISTFVGMRVGGFLGAFLSTLGVILPSFIIILLVAKIFESFKKNKLVNGAMSGLKPAVIGLIGAATVEALKSAFSFQTNFAFLNMRFMISVCLFVICLMLLMKKVHPILIIVLSAIVGIITFA